MLRVVELLVAIHGRRELAVHDDEAFDRWIGRTGEADTTAEVRKLSAGLRRTKERKGACLEVGRDLGGENATVDAVDELVGLSFSSRPLAISDAACHN